jgi:hypothetical protein
MRKFCVMARISPDFSQSLLNAFRCTFQVRGPFFRTHREYGVSRRVNFSGNIDLLSPRGVCHGGRASRVTKEIRLTGSRAPADPAKKKAQVTAFLKNLTKDDLKALLAEVRAA